MLFGQSVFQSVLDRLREEEPGEAIEESTYRISGLNSGFTVPSMEGVCVPSGRPDQAYVDLMEEEALAIKEEVAHEGATAPAHLLRIDPAEIAEELAIDSHDTQESLGEKRRLFARDNHPDRIAPAFRDNATIRMKIANFLIDEALRRLHPRSARR